MQMKLEQYQIRNFNTSDWNDYLNLYLTAVAEGKEESLGISPEQLQVQLEAKGNLVSKNIFMVEKNKKIIGTLYTAPERGIRRIIMYCFVHPSHRRKKLGQRLFVRGFKYAGVLGLNKVHVSVDNDNKAGIAFLKKLGFRYIRKYLEMQKKLGKDIENTIEPPKGFYFRCLQKGEENKLAQLQNYSFQDSWGFNPNTTEEVKLWLRLKGGFPEDVILTFFGEKPVGYCWTLIDSKKRIGKIHMIGVKPQYRGKNLGKALLTKGISYLGNKGMERAVLTVDSDNEPAKNLYYHLGFRVTHTSLWYEKRID